MLVAGANVADGIHAKDIVACRCSGTRSTAAAAAADAPSKQKTRARRAESKFSTEQ
jgi:hypothetical protein